jgi:hypothetical protein
LLRTRKLPGSVEKAMENESKTFYLSSAAVFLFLSLRSLYAETASKT